MKLYQLPYSHHCAKVRVTLLEKGLTHELPPLPGGSTRSPEFLALSPLGKVPVLVAGDTVIAESEVIVEYLEEIAPSPVMLPRGAAQRARSRGLTRFHDLYFGKQLSALFFGLARKGDPAMDAELDEMERLTALLEGWIEPEPYFFGAAFGIADATYALSVYYLGYLSNAFGRADALSRAPKLMRSFDAARGRRSVAAVIADCEAALAAR